MLETHPLLHGTCLKGDIEQIMDMVGNPNIPVVLVGNKSDLRIEREVQDDQSYKAVYLV